MNRFTKRKPGHADVWRFLAPAAVFLLVVGVFLYGIRSVERMTAREQLRSTEQAILRAAVQCYATEGFYPPGMDYLALHYGLIVDEDRYFVEYQCFASNIIPQIRLILRSPLA